MQVKRGFTLVEILIVVVILGILAAIVIPQFTQASTEAKVSSTVSTLQSLRSQIELYKIQHNDTPPTMGEAGATFTNQMVYVTDVDGTSNGTKVRNPAATPAQIYGPYLERMPVNPWNDSGTLAAADGTGVGWVYDEATGVIYVGVADVEDADLVTSLTEAGAVAPAAAAAP